MDHAAENKKLPMEIAWAPIGSNDGFGGLKRGNEEVSPGAAVGSRIPVWQTGKSTSAARIMKRKLSWLLAAVAYLVPPLWAYCATVELVAERCGPNGYGRQFLVADNIVRAWIASALLSFLAMAFSLAALSSVPSPRSKIRILETLAISLPFVGLVLVVMASAR